MTNFNQQLKNYFKMSTINITFIGNEKVGKTSIIDIIYRNEFCPDLYSTIGLNTVSIPSFSIYGQEIILRIWDTSGNKEYVSLVPMVIRNTSVIIIVFDVTNEDSFLDVQSWLKVAQDEKYKNPFIVLVGNKIDLIDQRKISANEAENFAINNNLHYFETSALNKDGIEDLFQYCATKSYNLEFID